MEENSKFQLDVSNNKEAIFPIQAHRLPGFLPQVPEWFGDPEAN